MKLKKQFESKIFYIWNLFFFPVFHLWFSYKKKNIYIFSFDEQFYENILKVTLILMPKFEANINEQKYFH